MSSNQNMLKIFSGKNNIELTHKICEYINVPLSEVYHHTFPSGELYTQYKENIRGCDVFLVSCRGDNTNDALMELLVMTDAARRASASRITAVLPFFYYSRQDRKERSRVPLSAKLVMGLLESAGVDRIITMDLHSPQIGGFTNLPIDHLTFEPVLCEWIKNNCKDIVLISPDVGGLKRIEKYANRLNCDFGFVNKKRMNDTEVSIQSIVGEVKDKCVVIIDDLTESCGTLIQAADICKERGATKIVCAITHGCFTEIGKMRLAENRSINTLVFSNTMKSTPKFLIDVMNSPMTVVNLDVSKIFATAIKCVHNNESISALFE